MTDYMTIDDTLKLLQYESYGKLWAICQKKNIKLPRYRKTDENGKRYYVDILTALKRR
jgi:hypothetical protein